jgi:Right handed beta helix region
MLRQRVLYFGLVVGVFVQTSASAAVRYAKPTATGSANCTTWANACTLGSAILAAQLGDDVWVQEGTYSPFNLKDGVKIIGGFAGTETLASQSNPTTNVTVVDGRGSERCVGSYNNGPGTVLRGFKIVNGYDGDDRGGGGLFMQYSDAMIVQCIFEHNTAAYLGGAAMIRTYSDVQFVNCIFRYNGSTSPTGTPYDGGAIVMFLYSTLTAVNCLFHDNQAWEGGAVLIGGDSIPDFINCTFANNRATGPGKHGGAINDESGVANLYNCVLWGNPRWDGFPEPIYSEYTQSGRVVTHSDVQGGWPGTGNINSNPLFQNPAANNYALQSSSPCKNTGRNAALPTDVADLDWDLNTAEIVPLDLSLGVRKSGISVDMGAYEFFENLQLPPNPPNPPQSADE